MTRTPILGLALAALALPSFALPALAQETTAEEPAADAMPAEETAPEAMATTEEAEADAAMSQGGTGALVNADGAQLGNASVSLTESGQTLVVVQGEGFPEGVHGVHLHMVGTCEGPAFESAEGHIAGDHDHGAMVASGPHPGDLPNAHVGSDGVLAMEAFAAGLTMDMLFDADGSALLVHADPDDYTSQPSGASGDRIACAVIEPGGDMAEGQ